MSFYTFRKNDARKSTSHGIRKSSQRTLCFRPYGIYPSMQLCEQMSLYNGTHVAISYSMEKPSLIFIRHADDPDDDEQTQTAKVHYALGQQRKSCKFNAREVVKHIFLLTGATLSITLYVSQKTTRINGKEYYRIMVENPLRIK